MNQSDKVTDPKLSSQNSDKISVLKISSALLCSHFLYIFFLTLSGFGWEWVRKCQDTARKSVCSHSVSGPTRSRRELDSQERICFHLISRPVLQTYKVTVRCQTSGCCWKNLEPLETSFSAVRRNGANTKGRGLMVSLVGYWHPIRKHGGIEPPISPSFSQTSFLLSKARSLFCYRSYLKH